MAAASPATGRSKWAALLALVLLVVLWWFTAGEDADSGAARPAADSAPSETGTGATRSPAPSAGVTSLDEDGLRWISAASLPDPAQEVLRAIDAGGPFEYAGKDGSTFGNYEGVLPQRHRGYYREYTVETPGVTHRGARRIVTGKGGQFYWTADHYDSFSRIRR